MNNGRKFRFYIIFIYFSFFGSSLIIRIDHITIPDPRGPSYPPMHRVEEVFDCWFESGAMPYAQLHYPFENKKRFEESFPADFIAEGLDQVKFE